MNASLQQEQIDNYVALAKQEDIAAKTALVKAYKSLIAKIAKMFKRNSMDFEDLMQEGYVKLLESIKSFNFDKKVKFSTYLYDEVFHHFSRLMPGIPINIKMSDKTFKRIKNHYNEYIKNFDVDKNQESMEYSLKAKRKIFYFNADRMNEKKEISKNTINSYVEMGKNFFGNNKEKCLQEFNEAQVTEVDKNQNLVFQGELKKDFENSMGLLTKKEQQAIIQYFGFLDDTPKSCSEIAKLMKINKAAVHEKLNRALKKLKRLPNIQKYSDSDNLPK